MDKQSIKTVKLGGRNLKEKTYEVMIRVKAIDEDHARELIESNLFHPMTLKFKEIKITLPKNIMKQFGVLETGGVRQCKNCKGWNLNDDDILLNHLVDCEAYQNKLKVKTRLVCSDCNHPKSYHSLGHCSKFVNEINRTCRCKGSKWRKVKV